MVLSSAVIMTGAAEPAQPTTWWSDNAATAFAGGNGTKDAPYQISSAAELAYFANYLEGGALNGRTEKTYFVLTADVDMSAHQWKPIGYTKGSNAYGENTLYNAEFDGGNHAITGVKLTASYAISGYTYDNGCALFTKIDDATIKNLKLEAKILDPVLTEGTYMPYSTTKVGDVKYDMLAIEKTTGNVASLVGCVYGDSVIDNVVATVDFDVNGTDAEYYYAGLVATTYEGKAIITNCTTRGTMDIQTPASIYARVSGVIGRYYAGLVDNLVNEIDINVTAAARADIGGVISATQNSPASTTDAEPANDDYALINKGDITVKVGAGSSYIGGVIGQGFAGKQLEKCLNEGNLTVTNNGYATALGGIIGYITSSENDMHGYKNIGTVKLIKKASANRPNVGGLVGQIAERGMLTECVNEGAVVVEISDNASDARVGGLVGSLIQGSFFDCENKGPVTISGVTGSVRVGGLAGDIDRKAGNVIDGCVNRGIVTFTDSASGATDSPRYIGGLVGFIAGPNNDIAIKDSANYAAVTYYAYGAAAIGGVAGNIELATVTVDNADNYGAITVENMNGNYHRILGGVIGQMNKGGKLINSDNFGVIWQKDVVLNANGTAGIVGTAQLEAVIEKCTNNAEVKLTVSETAGGANNRWVGGIVAQLKAASVIDCVNNGAVSVSGSNANWTHMGGIVGQADSISVIKNAINNADVSITLASSGATHAAGIVGYLYSSVLVSGCVNNGNVTTRANGVQYNGGIAGEIVASGATKAKAIENCVNNGAVTNIGATSNNAAAGIVSRISHASEDNPTVNIINCVNLAAISNSSLSGGIVGYTSAAAVLSAQTDTKDYNQNNLKTDKISIVKYPYTVNFENCVSLGSGTKYSIVGSNRCHIATFKNCFGDTEYMLSYYNQNTGYWIGVGKQDVVIINGTQVDGNEIPYNTDTYAKIELETLNKASVRIDDTGKEESAIRFDSYITKASYDALSAITGISFELGTLIAPTANLTRAEIVAAYDKMAALDALAGDGDALYTKVPYGIAFLNSNNYNDLNRKQYNYFAGALNNVPAASYNVEFSAIAYLTVKSGDFEFTFYADFDENNADRQRSIAQVAGLAFEDRAEEKAVIGQLDYKYEANTDNACFLGGWSIYTNEQLARLKAFSAYVNPDKAPEGLHVNGVSISEYKIVYAQSPIYKKYGSNTGKTLIEDLSNVRLLHDNGTYVEYGDVLLGAKYDYDYQTAVRLQQIIKDKFGIELEIVEDAATAETKYEILVGLTNRSQTQNKNVTSISVDSFIFRIDGSKIVICGGTYGTTWHAVDELETLFADLNKETYNLKMAGDLSGYYHLKKVACIGDSITRGSQSLPDGSTYGGVNLGAPGVFGSTATSIYFEQFLSYPANLQRLMWKDAVIYNFGRGASTARNYGDSNYYAGSPQWKNCLTASADDDIDFDLVFFMHGTNDAGRTSTAKDLEDFTAEHKMMMDAILEGSPDAQFVFNSVPHLFDGTGANRNEYNENIVREYVKVMAQNFLNEGYKTHYYSMSDFQKNNLINEGKTPCTRDDAAIPSGGMDSKGEKEIHSDYYNINTPCATNEGTHPNFRGYNKMADGVASVVNYLLFGGEKPQYMFDLVPPQAQPQE